MLVMFGRVDGESGCPNSSNHIWVNSVHNTFENPTAGRSGRDPLTIFEITAASRLVCSKGFRPVITCGRSLRHVTGAAEANEFAACLENRHSKGIDIRALRRELSPGTSVVPIFFRV